LALTYPESSRLAKVYFVLKCFIVILFICQSMASTHYYFTFRVAEKDLVEHMKSYEEHYSKVCADTQNKPPNIIAICKVYHEKFLKAIITSNKKRYLSKKQKTKVDFRQSYGEEQYDSTQNMLKKEQSQHNKTQNTLKGEQSLINKTSNALWKPITNYTKSKSVLKRYIKRNTINNNIIECIKNCHDEGPQTFVKAPYEWLSRIELFLIAYFIVEYLIELICSPSKLQHIITFYSVVDLLSIFASLFAYCQQNILNPEKEYTQGFGSDDRRFGVIDAFGSLKLLRVFVILKNFRGFKLMVFAIRFSFKDLLCFLVNIGVVVVIMSFFIYHAEKLINANFSSIPEAMWWTIVTVTSVGYGDIVPKSPLGRIIGTVTALSGVLCTALLVPLFMNDFMVFNKVAKISEEKKEKALVRLLEQVQRDISRRPAEKSISKLEGTNARRGFKSLMKRISNRPSLETENQRTEERNYPRQIT